MKGNVKIKTISIILSKNHIITLMITLFLVIIFCDFITSKYFEIHYKKELKAYGKNKTYFSISADMIGLTLLTSISDIAVIAGPIQKFFLMLLLIIVIYYSWKIMYLDWEDIIHFAKKDYRNKHKKTSN